MKRTLLFLVLAASLGLNLQAQLPAERQAAEIQQTQLASPISEDTKLKLHTAAAIQEIILSFLADHDYEAVYPEFEKLLALELEGEFEGLLAEATWVIVGDLRQNRQFALAHKIIDSTLSTASLPENKYSLLILKGQTFRDQGRNRDAVRTYREALKYQN